MGRVARREAGYLGGIGLRTGSIETEIVGGVDIHEEGVGYDAWGRLVRWHDEVLASQMAAYGGDVVRTTGDGIFVTFVDPDAALGCAVAIQEALREHRSKNGSHPRSGSASTWRRPREKVPTGAEWASCRCADRWAGRSRGDPLDHGDGGSRRPRVSLLGAAQRHAQGLSEPIAVIAVEWG